MPAWTDPDWLSEAHGWIEERADELRLRVTGAIEQPHVRPWSTVLRVPTTGGDVWFKANGPTEAYEAGVVSVLAGRRPDCVPDLLAADLERGWMLVADGGERLREVVARERDLGRWLDVLPLYAGLQIDLVDHAGELLTLGTPDRRLATLSDQYEGLLDRLEPSSVPEIDRLRKLTPGVREMCDELAAYGIPETIQHDDLHDGQVFVRDGRYLLFDWGDSVVSHPFFTMSVTLEGVLSWGLDDIEGSVDTTPFRDAYLGPFERYAPRADLEAALAIALRLGWVCRALGFDELSAVLDPQAREEHADAVAIRLRMFLAGFP